MDRAANFAMVTLIVYGCMTFIAFCLYLYKKYIYNFSAAQIDGMLYCLISGWIAVQSIAQSPETFQYCNPYMIFYGKSLATVLLAMAAALKTFRSRSYGDEQDEKKKSGNTNIWTKPPETGTT